MCSLILEALMLRIPDTPHVTSEGHTHGGFTTGGLIVDTGNRRLIILYM